MLLKYHPIFYVHVFVFGMLLAVIRNHLKDEGTQTPLANALRLLIQCGATIGYTGLLVIFTVRKLQPISYELSARLGLLLPLHGIMILGLSPLSNGGTQDPLAKLFSYAPRWMSDMSYCQYVLQLAVYELFPKHKITNPSFFFCLWGASLLTCR